MKLRKLRLIAVPVAAAIMLMGSVSPAEAAGTGVVTGSVSTSPGVPLGHIALDNSVTFNSTAIVGAIQVGTCAFAGTIDVSASATATDTLAAGTGTVLSLSGTGSTADLVSITVNLAAATTVQGIPVENIFVRVGQHVTVILGLNVTVNVPGNSCSGRVTAIVEAEFVATTTNGTHITDALFAGNFTVAP